jgi:hypothetical protein
MSIYDLLRDYLLSEKTREFEMTFREIESITGRSLPASADQPQWWANQVAGGRPQREAWRAAGFDAYLIAGSRKVKFRRVA